MEKNDDNEDKVAELGPEQRVKKDPRASHTRRLRAVMGVLGYGNRQKDFAAEIGVERAQLNNIINGTPLSKTVAFAIFRRFRMVSLEFLWFGLPGYGQPDFEQKLLEWERRTGSRIFIGLPGP